MLSMEKVRLEVEKLAWAMRTKTGQGKKTLKLTDHTSKTVAKRREYCVNRIAVQGMCGGQFHRSRPSMAFAV